MLIFEQIILKEIVFPEKNDVVDDTVDHARNF